MKAELENRYDNAITLLSGVSPLLAFELRSKNSLSLSNSSRNSVRR